MEIRKWLRQQSKDFGAPGFDALVKRWANISVSAEDMSRNKFNFCFQVIISHVLRFISSCDLLIDSPSYLEYARAVVPELFRAPPPRLHKLIVINFYTCTSGVLHLS
jgi:hypothetical protein